MNRSPIEIVIGQMNAKIEDEVVKACVNVGVNVNKEELLNALKSLDFVRELVEYIFTYPDDDYMTMECLCRKLRKHNLIWYADGQYMPLKLGRAEQTEPQYDIDKGTIKCDNCSENGSYKCSKCDGEMYFKRLEVEDEPQTEREGE